MKQLRSIPSRSNLSVSRLSQLFGVAKSSFYQSLKTSQNVDKVNQINALKDKEITMFKRHKRRLGYRELWRHLIDSGIKTTAYRVYQIMRKHGLKARSYKRKSYVKPSVAPNNLLKLDFNQSAPNQAWAGDITYLQAGGKTVYLAVIMDLYASKIVAWQLKESMDAALVCDLLKQAIQLRGYPSDLLFHSDRGSQYETFAQKNKKKLDNVVTRYLTK
jgi:transposase InsO family protein